MFSGWTADLVSCVITISDDGIHKRKVQSLCAPVCRDCIPVVLKASNVEKSESRSSPDKPGSSLAN